MNAMIGMDVGGTTVKTGLFADNLTPLAPPRTCPAHADGSPEGIVRTLCDAAQAVWKSAAPPGAVLRGVGFAFPGPFDYEKGISFMRGLGKYESLYGYPLGEALLRAFRALPELPASPDFCLRFENDAAAFAKGEWLAGDGAGVHRLLALTLGTGCGSTFLEDGNPVRGRDGVPEDGMLYHLPFRGETVDDRISRRGIRRLAAEYRLPVDADVRDLAQMPEAAPLFSAFGRMLGEMLVEYASAFAPDLVILGGNISRNFPLFAPGMRAVPGMEHFRVRVSAHMEQSALIGAASLIAPPETSRASSG